jgi:hypothetical protein
MNEELGKQLKQIPLASSPYLAPVLWGILSALIIAGMIMIRLVSLSILVGVVSLIVEGVFIYFGHRFKRDVTEVTVYDNGMILQIGMNKQTIFWDEIEGVQMSEYADSFKERVSETMPFMIPIPGLIIFGMLSQSGWRSTFSAHADYVFHTRDAKTYAIGSSNPRVFSLKPYVKEKVLKRVTPATIRKFENGDEVPLVRGVTYSKQGINGQYSRKRKRSQRTITIDLTWDQVQRINYLTDSVRINAKNHQQIIFPLGEIINRGAFIAVLKSLNEGGRVPRVEGA